MKRRESMKPHILLIEDNEMNRDMLTRRLERSGFEVVCASEGRQGIDMAMGNKFDLILMDIGLPDMSGIEATKELKQLYQTSGIPIIVLTAHATTAAKTKSIEVGCDDFATKPIHFKLLIEKINYLLSKKS